VKNSGKTQLLVSCSIIWLALHLLTFPRIAQRIPGTSLVKLGEAHSKVAMLQGAYALTFQDTFLASIKNFGEDFKDYEHQRKKLESRR
jgi:hypothetical protein